MDSCLLLDEAAVIRKTFARVFLVHQLRTSPAPGNLAHGLSHLPYFPFGLLQSPLHVVALKRLLESYKVQNAAEHTVFDVHMFTHITLLLCKLHWLPVPFQVQFKELVIICVALVLVICGTASL